MKYVIAYLFLMTMSVLEIKAEVDPNFYIYLCFGQSNMEGNAPPEAIDMEYVDDRFQTLAATNFSSPSRTMGQWYTAYPPIVRESTRLGMADYFGRSMVAALPANCRVGVVDVAIGGVDIRAFMSEKVSDYIWIQPYSFSQYKNDPYKRLVEMAKIAQNSGVIKGILLHQGEANNGNPEWPQWVKTIYERLLKDLGLKAADVPLLVGEVVNASENGACAKHNTVIATVPTVIPTSHVISSVGCPCLSDHLHFTASGYRVMGKRYAAKALELLGYPAHKDAAYTFTPAIHRFYKAAYLGTHIDINLLPGTTYNFNVTAYFEDYHNENVSSEVVVTCSGNGVTANGTQLKVLTGESSLVTVSYTDFTGETVSTSFYVNGSAAKRVILKANDGTREYGEPNPAFGYTTDGGDINGTPDVYCEATATSPVGTYPIKISKGSITDDNVDYVDGTLTITKAPLTITANSCTRVEGETEPPFEVTYSGFKNGETDSVLIQKPIVTTTATQDSEYGIYDISVSGAEAQNYTFNYINGTLTLTERKIPITIDGITYEGLRSSLTAEVVSFDQSGDSLAIQETVSDEERTYRVTSIGRRAFYKCGDITSVTLPNSVTFINSSAFEDCSALTSISLGDSLTYIGGSAFEDCVVLPAITIPNSVTTIELNAFKNCPSLTTVKSEIEYPFEIRSDVFSGISPEAELIVPDGTSAVYQTTAGWDQFSKITEVSAYNDSIDVKIVSLADDKDYEVTIYSLSGQRIARTSQHAFSHIWNSLPKGVYIIRSNEGRSQGKNGQKRIK